MRDEKINVAPSKNNGLHDIKLHKIRVITGHLTLVAVLVTLFYAILFYILQFISLANISLVISILAVSSRLAWRKGYIDYARFSLIIIGNAFVFMLCGSLGRQSGINFLYFPLSCAILILYDLRQNRYLVAAFVITFVCLAILEITNYEIITFTMPSAYFIQLTRVISIFVSLIITLICVFSMQWANNNAEKTLAEAEQSINRYATKMESKNQELEQFVYIASHDLNEPLRTVSSFVDLLSEDYEDKLDSTAKQSFLYIKKAASRMNQLIVGLLDYGRLGQNQEIKSVNFNEIVKSVLLDLGLSLNNAGAKVYVDDLPELPVFEIEIRQLFQNLISNAIKFRKEGQAPEIHISAVMKEGTWRFSIKDNGIGIDPLYKEKIFLIFQRLNNRDDYEGTGIGLSYCKKIVDIHNGKIWVESETNQGSTFYFTLNT